MVFSSNVPVITIDGPSGSGKGTLAARIATHYHFHLLDSGALYRLLALAAEPIAEKLNVIDDETTLALVDIALNLDIEFKNSVNQPTAVLLAGRDVTLDIRAEHIGHRASKVAALPQVRDALLARQRAFAKPLGLVADGRDMGTVVFTDAPIKFYLTASVEARAKRRLAQLQQNAIGGILPTILVDTVFADLVARDKRDMERAVAPLIAADDAVVIDASDLTIEQVFAQMCRYIDLKLAKL